MNGIPALRPNTIKRMPLTGRYFWLAKQSSIVKKKAMVDEVVMRVK